jgi:hypothetical protein
MRNHGGAATASSARRNDRFLWLLREEQRRERLVAILKRNLERATEPDLRERLERAIAALKERKDAAA